MSKLALVTGASAGIGTAFARHLAARGYDLALTARRRDRLNALANQLESKHSINCLVIEADLADNTAPLAILDTIKAEKRNVDVLINNAGYGLPGTFMNTDWQAQADFLQVLLNAPCELVHRTLPHMAQARWGRIINVASLVSFTPGSKGHTLYGPVKAALMRFSESVNAETQDTGIHVTALCPGLTRSEFHDANGTRSRLNQVPGFMWQSAEEVVDAGWEACEKNQPVIVTGGVNKVLAGTAKVLPDVLGRRIMRAQTERYRNSN